MPLEKHNRAIRWEYKMFKIVKLRASSRKESVLIDHWQDYYYPLFVDKMCGQIKKTDGRMDVKSSLLNSAPRRKSIWGVEILALPTRWRSGRLATRWRTPRTRRTGGWEGPIAGLDLLEKKKKSNYGFSFVQALLLHRMSYSDCWDKNNKGKIWIMKGRMKKNKCITKKERTKEWKERTRLRSV